MDLTSKMLWECRTDGSGSRYSPLAGFCQDSYDPTRSIKSISQQAEWTISFLKRTLTHAGY